MKKCLFAVVVLSFFFSSCHTVSSFESPDSFRNLHGTLYLANGKTFEGRLIIQTGNLFGPVIKAYAEGDKIPAQFNVRDVVGYRIDRGYFALKHKEGSFAIERGYAFMKRLSPEDSKIHLYEAQEKERESGKGSQSITSRYQTEYYVEFPHDEEAVVHSVNGSRIVPHFEEKISRLVSDCPSLAKKIAAKENGYVYAQVSFFKEKKKEVWLRIIEEYNRCP